MSSPSPSKEHIATFHTHFGALTFHKKLKALGDNAVMMPVPRKLSASCGTCVTKCPRKVLVNIHDDGKVVPVATSA